MLIFLELGVLVLLIRNEAGMEIVFVESFKTV